MKNNLEVILKKPEGRIKIHVRLVDISYAEFKYTYCIEFCEKGKRTWKTLLGDVAVTDQEILDAKLRLWENLKPTHKLTR